MKRYQGLSVVLILGIIVLVTFVIKRPSSSSKKSQQVDQASQHNSSAADTAAHDTAMVPQAPTESSKSKLNSMTRSLNRSAASQTETAATQMTVRGSSRNFVKHEISPLKRKISESELRNSEVVSGNWKLVTTLYAVSKTLVAQSDYGSSVGEQNGFSFFEAEGVNLQESLFSNERPLVVYDSRLQTFGVLTGTIQIELRKGADVAGLLQQYGAKVQNVFPETGTYYITSQEQPFNFVQLKNSLERDSRVNHTEVEIVSRRYGKQ